MKGDFTRWTFDPENQFTRVLMQQGRVQLDADWNEQAAILLHRLQMLAEDLIGPFGAPPNPDGTAGDGFRLALQIGEDGQVVPNVYRLLKGRYYVGGLLVENPAELVKRAPGGTLPDLGKGTHLLYLDVWERLVTHVQDDRIREVALGGVDTAARARLTWRVRSRPVKEGTTCFQVQRRWAGTVTELQPENRGRLKAQAQRTEATNEDACITAPEARYTGENQLYRVEIHKGGTAADEATFKWSRENGSVIFPVLSVTDQTVALEHLGRDGRFDLDEGDRVEILDQDADLLDQPGPLFQVKSIDRDRVRVTLDGSPSSEDLSGRYLRRWEGLTRVREREWLNLENGVQIYFEAAPEGQEAHAYRSGDAWLIPARTATGDVEWPRKGDDLKSLPPHFSEHRYAPLALVAVTNNGMTIHDCRSTFGARAWLLDTGAADWMLVRGPGAPPTHPAVPVKIPDVGWSQALLPARWISALDTAEAPGGISLFELRFHLRPRFRHAALSLSLLADNSAVVKLNGEEIVRHERQGDKGFTGEPSRKEVEDPALFRAGENVLTVEVTNSSPSVMGFVLAGRVDSD